MSKSGVDDVKVRKAQAKKSDKRFATRSEEFCAFMESLGYELPRHAKPEHFDYIFQNSETAKIARQMMTTIRPENIIDSKELAEFDRLKKENQVLYGADLETAFEKRKALDVKKSKREAANVVKAQELERKIEQQKAEIQRIKMISATLDDTLLLHEKEQEARECRADFEKQECKKLDEEIRAQKNILIDLTTQLREKLNMIHSKITTGYLNEKKKTGGHTISRLCQLDWIKVLEDEDKLHSLIKSLYQTYTSDFHKETAKEDVNYLESEAMFRIFKQNENHLERLKHLIIYEKVREVEMDIQMTGSQAILNNLENIVEEAKQLTRLEADIQNRMVQDIQSANERLWETCRLEREALFDTVRHDEAARLTNEIREIFDLQIHAKKKLHDFYVFLVHILTHQRVRIDLARELIRIENFRDERITRLLEEFQQKMSGLSKMNEQLTNDKNIPTEAELSFLLKKYNISSVVNQNPWSKYEAVNFDQVQMTRMSFAQSLKDDAHLITKSNLLTHKQEHLQHQFEITKLKTLAKGPTDKAISEVLEVHEQLQDKLSFQKENKERLAKESIASSLDYLCYVKSKCHSSF